MSLKKNENPPQNAKRFGGGFHRNVRYDMICLKTTRFSEGPDSINDVQNNITSLLLIFNKSVVFRQQMLFFHSNFDFYLNESILINFVMSQNLFFVIHDMLYYCLTLLGNH